MAEPGTGTDAGEPRSPWLRPGFVLAAAFVGFVTVVGGAVAVTSGAQGDKAPAASVRSPAPDAETGGPADDTGPTGRDTAADAADGGSCPGLSDGSEDVPDSAPAGVTWSLYHGVALPSSKAAGPAVPGPDVARCYAHTPVGALLASSQIGVRYLAAEDWRAVTRAQTVGAGRDTYLARRAAAEQTAAPDQEGTAHGQIAGFRFVTYHSTEAVIDTVWRFPDGRMQAAGTTVLWREGDWLLEYPTAPPAPTPVDSLAGYVAWGGM